MSFFFFLFLFFFFFLDIDKNSCSLFCFDFSSFLDVKDPDEIINANKPSYAPTSKKLTGHIGFGLSVRASVRPFKNRA